MKAFGIILVISIGVACGIFLWAKKKYCGADPALMNEARSYLRLSGFDPGEEERAAVVAWLRRYQRKNSEARSRSREPAHEIDLRARANSCQMHAIWISMGKHREPDSSEGISIDELLEIRSAVRDLTDATMARNGEREPDNALVEVYVSDLRSVLGIES